MLILTGAVAGFIDSIAGGGGLITLPVLTMIFGSGAHAIGTNKIVGTVGAAIALAVYAQKGQLKWREGLYFVFWIGVGSYFGSRLTPLLPMTIFRWLLVIICPIILWVVWNKDRWILFENRPMPLKNKKKFFSDLQPNFVLAGLLCGAYDGAFGPGGGTFMFLALLYVVKLPLFAALAVSKLANTCSASVALATYASGGFVHWKVGSLVALGMAGGAFAGSRLASKKASTVVRPMLVIAVTLLMTKLLWDILK